MKPELSEAPHTVYAVVRGSDRLLLYVGVTTRRLQVRLANHKSAARGGSTLPFHRWLRADRSRLADLDVVALDVYSNRAAGLRAELETIRALTCAGCSLLNVVERGSMADRIRHRLGRSPHLLDMVTT